MEDTRVISAVLLFGRLVTLFFLIWVMSIQWKLIKLNKPPALQNLRIVLFVLVGIIVCGQFFPVLIDIYGIFDKANGNMVILYAFSNNGTAMISALMLWVVYRVSMNTKI